ncbi:hypothetical protein OAG28_02410, partial [Akkermansiaceae bacterium]|nr:hypothetical protein [Akkermansiaceae bacterium]
ILFSFLIVISLYNTSCKSNEFSIIEAKAEVAQAEAEKAQAEAVMLKAEAEKAKAEEERARSEVEKTKVENEKIKTETENIERKLASLKDELIHTNESIDLASKEDSKLAGGLIKSLIGARLELLKINSALLRQRINVIESGAKIEIKLYEAKPNDERAAKLQSEMDTIKSKIKVTSEKIALYEGGLIKVTLMSSAATMENTLALLQLEYLKAKYGIYWLPSKELAKKSTLGNQSNVSPEARPVAPLISEKILIPKISNKKLKKAQYDSNIWFDITWNTDNLKKKTRAIKGILIFADIFGDSKFMIGKTINDPLHPLKPHVETGVGFEYNQFKDAHQWMLSTDLKDMTFKFEVTNIIYEDGTTEELN